MTFSKALIDTNICLDAVLNRKPFAAHALELTERSQAGDFEGMVAAHSFDTLFYLLKKVIGKEKAYKGIKILRKAYNITPVTEHIIDAAIQIEWNDFEDAIHHESARVAGCNAIITRNQKDFKESELLVFSPQEFLDQFNHAEEE